MVRQHRLGILLTVVALPAIVAGLLLLNSSTAQCGEKTVTSGNQCNEADNDAKARQGFLVVGGGALFLGGAALYFAKGQKRRKRDQATAA